MSSLVGEPPSERIPQRMEEYKHLAFRLEGQPKKVPWPRGWAIAEVIYDYTRMFSGFSTEEIRRYPSGIRVRTNEVGWTKGEQDAINFTHGFEVHFRIPE